MIKNFGPVIALVVLFLGSTIGVVDGANLIANPGFESGTTSWTFYASGGGTFTTPSPGYVGNKYAQLVLSNAGMNIQLYQTPVILEANTRYRLSFSAYSNTGHDMTVRLLKHTSPYTLYMPDFTVNLATTWQTFSNEFTSNGFSGTVNDGRLMFWLPQYVAKGDNYYIDDVRLEKIPQGPIEINSCTRISSPGEYVLTQSIMNSNVANCIDITSGDVIFDGAGYTIDGNGDTNYGLSANNVNRITVKNLVVQDWNTRAVNIVNSNNNNFSNITVKSGNYEGFYLQNSNNNILRNITVLNTGHVGFTFDSSQGNDLNGATLQNNAWEDFDIYITGGISSCNNAAKNVFLTNNYKLHYYNETVHLNGITAGAIYLCNADNSVITNVEVISINEQNSISNYYVENVTYTNIVTSGLQEAIFFKNSANNNITNILMKDGWSGITYSTNTNNTNFKNATIYNMTDRAIRMYAGASKNSISDSKIYNNSVGIYLNTAGKYGPNRIYNSFFNNTQNIEWGIPDFFGDGSVYPNYWNTTKQPGMNIMGGSNLGGNFWGYPNGTGFSQTCLDDNSDGICDSVYTLKSNNIDYLPLALPSIQSITVVSPNGGENWAKGSTHMILWNYRGSTGPNVRIELLKNGLFNSVLTSSTPIGSSGSGSYNWLINLTQTLDADYKVRINSTDNSTYTDMSNNNFAILPVSDTSPPIIIGSTPTGPNVPIGTQITVTFNESMNQSSAQTAFSTVPATTGSFTWSGNMMIYTPSPALNAGATYAITVGTGAKDLAGNALASAFSWQFTTITTNPGDGIPSGYLILGTTKVSPPGYTYTGDLIVSSTDSGEGRWTAKAPMPTARYGLATAVVNNKIYAIGGHTNPWYYYQGLSNMNEEYDPVSNSWTSKAPMTMARIPAVVVVNNKIYAIGGYNDQGLPTNLNEEYDPASNSWTTKTPMTVARDPEVVVVNNKIYAIGGWINQENPTQYSNLNEEYDPAFNSWTTKAPMAVARDPEVVVVNNKIYAIGGNTNQWLPANLNEEYDSDSNLWTTKAPMPTARVRLDAAVVNNKIYAIGPNEGGLMYKNLNEEYDPASNSWTSKAHLATKQSGFAIAVVNNKIYAIGGSYDGRTFYFSQNEEYDPSSDLWSTKASMPTARDSLTAVVMNNKIYAIGGTTRDPEGNHIITNVNEEFSINNIYYIHLKN